MAISTSGYIRAISVSGWNGMGWDGMGWDRGILPKEKEMFPAYIYTYN